MYKKTITIDEEELLREADEIIAGELDELNRKSRFCYTPTEIAKEYGMNGADLNSFLKDRGIIQKTNGCFHLTRKFRNQGLADYRHTVGYDRNGQRKMKAKLVWTEQGRIFLKEIIASDKHGKTRFFVTQKSRKSQKVPLAQAAHSNS